MTDPRRRKREGPLERAREWLRREIEEAALETEVQSALLSLAPVSGLRIDVDAEEGVIYLRGEVATAEQSREAERLVRRLVGRAVKRVVNELRVNPDLAPPVH